MHTKNLVTAGTPLGEAKKVLLMLHGRGAGAHDILSLSQYLTLPDFAILAPQAANSTWYPYSFLVPPQQNEPYLSSAIHLITDIISDIQQQGITNENIYLLGFSQGACLSLEFGARNASRFGGIIAFIGGLIGDVINPSNYTGNFAGTPVFIGSSNPDFHIPVERVQASADVYRSMGAEVIEKIYPNLGHTINEEELHFANSILNH